MIAYLLGAFVLSVIIGQVSSMIAHSNPGEKAKADAVGLIHGFLYERHVSPILTRKIRTFCNVMYDERGTTQHIDDIMSILPKTLRTQLGAELGFIDSKPSKGKHRPGIFSKISFFRGLPTDDMIRIGGLMTPMRAFAKMDEGTMETADYIMQEGTRGNEMWVLLEGAVEITRSTTPSDRSAGHHTSVTAATAAGKEAGKDVVIFDGDDRGDNKGDLITDADSNHIPAGACDAPQFDCTMYHIYILHSSTSK